MHRSLFVLASFAVACAACSSSTSSTTAGSGGHGTTTSTKTATGTGGEAASSSSATGTTTTTSGTGGGDAGSMCSDPTNPMFNSCITTFLAGCWAPDTAGTCTDMNGTVTWSDGSKYETQGSAPGLYGPGETTPCISLVIGASSFTATKGTQVLKYAADSTTMTGTITCPDGTSFTATSDQVTTFNTCVGINCH